MRTNIRTVRAIGVSVRSEESAAAALNTRSATVAYEYPTPSVPAQEWACAGDDPGQFFPEDEATLAAAQLVCSGCGLREVCLSLALARGESGVWGGLFLENGKVLDGIPAKGRPRKTAAA